MRYIIKVLNIIEEARFGGPQRRIAAVASKLKEHDIETVVIMPKYDSDVFLDVLDTLGVKSCPMMLHRLTKEKLHLLKYILLFPLEIFLLYREIKSQQADLVHTNGSYQLKGAIAAKLAGVPLIYHLNDTYAIAPLRKLFYQIAKRTATAFIVAGQRVYDYYIKGTSFETRLYTEIHAPVDVMAFDPDVVGHNDVLAAQSATKIVTIANINPAKDLRYFIEMAGLLNQRFDNLHFYIAGATHKSQEAYHAELKELANNCCKDNLTFMGRISDVSAVLNDADIVVFTSATEASPTAVWEAMSMQKAIVCTDAGSVSQYIQNGKSGFIVPIKDTEALTQKVERLLRDVPLRVLVSKQARDVAIKKLDISIAAQKHAEFYRSVIESAK